MSVCMFEWLIQVQYKAMCVCLLLAFAKLNKFGEYTHILLLTPIFFHCLLVHYLILLLSLRTVKGTHIIVKTIGLTLSRWVELFILCVNVYHIRVRYSKHTWYYFSIINMNCERHHLWIFLSSHLLSSSISYHHVNPSMKSKSFNHFIDVWAVLCIMYVLICKRDDLLCQDKKQHCTILYWLAVHIFTIYSFSFTKLVMKNGVYIVKVNMFTSLENKYALVITYHYIS